LYGTGKTLLAYTLEPFIGDLSPLIVFFTLHPSIRFERMTVSVKVRFNRKMQHVANNKQSSFKES
jgi:hypothetical protein